MRKLSKKERHEVYKKALELVDYNYIQEHYATGLCYLFSNYLNVNIYYQYRINESNYDIMPELNLFIIEDYPSINWNDRRLILMFCIEMTA